MAAPDLCDSLACRQQSRSVGRPVRTACPTRVTICPAGTGSRGMPRQGHHCRPSDRLSPAAAGSIANLEPSLLLLERPLFVPAANDIPHAEVPRWRHAVLMQTGFEVSAVDISPAA